MAKDQHECILLSGTSLSYYGRFFDLKSRGSGQSVQGATLKTHM